MLCILLIVSATALAPRPLGARRGLRAHTSSRSRTGLQTPRALTPRWAAPLPDAEKPEGPDATKPEGLAECLECSFVHACIQLATGIVDPLKFFIATAVAAYERGFTLSALQLELSMLTTQSAGRPLMREELDLRTVWLSLVYLALGKVQHPSEASALVGASVPADIRQKFECFVSDVVDARADGASLPSLKLEDMLRRADADELAALSTMERAILGQAMRVVFLTITVLEETEAAGGSKPNKGKNPDPPGPFIPGTF